MRANMTIRVYFYQTERGVRDVRVFLRSLPPKHCAKCLDYLKRVRQHGTSLPRNIVAYLEQGLWEARPEYGGIEYRFFFFVHTDNRIGVVAALVKKRQKLERSTIERALRLAEEMRQTWEQEANDDL